MPQVGKKKFAYSAAGKKKAKIYAKKSKQKVKKGQIMGKKKASGDWKEKGKEFLSKSKKSAAKMIKAGGKSYGSYVAPTVGLFKSAGTAATNVGKFALKSGALGIPGAVATGLYYGGKAIVNKGEKTALRSAFKQYDKKGKWML